jgi:hypothetical protein
MPIWTISTISPVIVGTTDLPILHRRNAPAALAPPDVNRQSRTAPIERFRPADSAPARRAFARVTAEMAAAFRLW